MCGLCGNTISEDAEDGDTALKNAVTEVQAKMATFMAAERDAIDREGDKYVMKDRLIKLSIEKMERVKQKREALKANKMQAQVDAEAAQEEKIFFVADLGSEKSTTSFLRNCSMWTARPGMHASRPLAAFSNDSSPSLPLVLLHLGPRRSSNVTKV